MVNYLASKMKYCLVKSNAETEVKSFRDCINAKARSLTEDMMTTRCQRLLCYTNKEALNPEQM